MSDQTVVCWSQSTNFAQLAFGHNTYKVSCIGTSQIGTKNSAKINKHCSVIIFVRPEKVELVVSWWAGSTYLLLLCVYKIYKEL